MAQHPLEILIRTTNIALTKLYQVGATDVTTRLTPDNARKTDKPRPNILSLLNHPLRIQALALPGSACAQQSVAWLSFNGPTWERWDAFDPNDLDKLATAWAIFQGLLLEAIPFLLLGVAIAGLARWAVPPGAWIDKLPKNPVLAPIIGALMGFALPACECGNVPVARRLLASGAPMGTAFGFLFAAPVLNPIVLASTWAAFPDQPWLLVARPLGAFLLAILLSVLLVQLPETQLLATALLEERRMSQPLSNVGLLQRSSGLIGASTTTTRPATSQRLKGWEVLNQSCREFLDLIALLVLGCVIAALVQTWLPRSWLLAVGGAPTASILALMLLAVVVSVCSSVDAFLALGFAAQITPGALLAFLLLGPVVDLKLAGLFTVLMRPRAILITAISASLGVLLIGQWINLWQL